MNSYLSGWRGALGMRQARASAVAAMVAVVTTLSPGASALAQNVSAEIKQSISAGLAQRLPRLPALTQVRATPIPGLYEVQIDKQLIYTDAQANTLINGDIIDLRTKRNLTEERTAQILKIDFSKLPLKDAVVWKSGNGQRKIVVFAEPHCGYCKKLEAELQQVKNVTVYSFLYPIFGPESAVMAKNIWCSKDRTNAWRQWMLQGKEPANQASCANPIERNMALGQLHRVQGTPAVIFSDGSRSPGFMTADQLEKKLTELER